MERVLEKDSWTPKVRYVKCEKCKVKDVDNNFTGSEEHDQPQIAQDLNFDISALDSSIFNSNPLLNDKSDSIIDSLFEKNQVLQTRWEHLVQRVEDLSKENGKLKELLTEERARSSKYIKKFQYIQENQPMFEKLKQAYITLKYNERAHRALVEVVERGCQTKNEKTYEYPAEKDLREKSVGTDKYLIKGCKCNLIANTVYDFNIEPGYMPIKKEEFNNIKHTVGELKDLLVSQPLSAFVLSENKESKYRKDIADLFMENRSLKQLVIDQRMEIDTLKQQSATRKCPKEINLLKKIIAKQTKHMQKCNVCAENNRHKNSTTSLNDVEIRIVDHIHAKYELKLHQKLQPIPKKSGTPKAVTPKAGTPYYTPRTGRTDDTFLSCEGEDSVSFDSI